MNETYEDIEVTCCDCGETFTWTAGEQKFLNELYKKGRLPEVTKPKRCKECRLKKKQKYADKEIARDRF